MNKIFKFFPIVKNRVNAKFGPVRSQDTRQTHEEIIHDFVKTQQLFNNFVYPLVASLPGQPLELAEKQSIDIDPVQNGLDGTQVFVDRLTTVNENGGLLWNTSKDRPNTINEQFSNVYNFVSEEVSRVGDALLASGGVPEAVQVRIGINAWQSDVASAGTTKLPPEGESIDARTLNSKSDIMQLASDLFSLTTTTGELLIQSEYDFDPTHPGVQTQPISLRARIKRLESIHDNDNESNKIPNHNNILQYGSDITDPNSTPPTLWGKITADGTDTTTLNIKQELGGRKTSYSIVQIGDSGDSPIEAFKIYRDLSTGEVNVVVNGNLTVQNGSMTTVTSEDLEVKDNIIKVNDGETGAGVTLTEAGLEVDRGTLTNTSILFHETYGWSIKENGLYKSIMTSGNDIWSRVNNMVEFMRYSRIILGVAGDMLYETNSITDEEFAKGTQQDLPSQNIMPVFTDASRQYRLMIQYSDEFLQTDNMNAVITITGADTSTHSITLPIADVDFVNGDNALFVSSLFTFNFEQDTTWSVKINNGDGIKNCDLMRVELVAYDVFTPLPYN